MKTTNELKRLVSEYSIALHARGWVANHDGNVSARTAGGGFLISPTAVSKRRCPPESIVQCDDGGAARSRGRPPSEVALHVGVYRARPKVQAVIHAHPPHASAFALARRPIDPVAMPEIVVSLGQHIPLAPLLLPKDPAAADVAAQIMSTADVALLTGNGVLAVGDDIEQAYLRLELLEHYAQILSIAKCLGGAVPLEPPAVHRMLQLRAKAGLGPDPGAPPAPDSGQTLNASLRPIIAEEVRRALGGES